MNSIDLMAYPEQVLSHEIHRMFEVLEHDLADLEAAPGQPQPGRGPNIDCGIDAEWEVLPDGTGNRILSIQLYLIGEYGELPCVKHVVNGEDRAKRPSLASELHQLILTALEQGILIEYPSRVRLIGFKTHYDLMAFSDFNQYKNQLNSVGGSVATLNGPIKFSEGGYDEILAGRTFVVDDRGILRLLRVEFRDAAKHAPPGASLAQLGKQIGIPKVEILPPYSIERMSEYQAKDKDGFEHYGITDAIIPIRYWQGLEETIRHSFGLDRLPTTSSAMAVTLFKHFLGCVDGEDHGQNQDDDQNDEPPPGISFYDHYGLRQITHTRWDANSLCTVRKTSIEHTPLRAIHEPFVARCYHGGLNACFGFGPTPEVPIYDYDLRGAYTTGLCDLPAIDFEQARVTTQLSDFLGHVVGFAYARFRHPPGSPYGLLPVRAAEQLFFPLESDEAYVTAPEIDLAHRHGVEIEILHGVVYPPLDATKDTRLFEKFTRMIREWRAREVKGSMGEQFAKLVGNGLYGKTAQGLHEKNVFDTRHEDSRPIPPSPVTNAVVAAHTTGFIRAVLAELLLSIPEHRTVISVTTDGFLTDATPEEISVAGPLCQRYQALCDRVAPEASESDRFMLEVKHHARQVIAMKTRGQITTIPDGDRKIVLAKANISAPRFIEELGRPPEDKAGLDAWQEKQRRLQSDYMVKLFLNRAYGDKVEVKSLTSMRKQWGGKDIVSETIEKTMNLEYDFKRRPVNPRMVAVCGGEHLAFDTEPWQTVTHAENARALFGAWRSTKERCLKTLADYRDWEDFYQYAYRKAAFNAQKQRPPRLTETGLSGLLIRMFLSAYTRQQYGFVRTLKGKQLAAVFQRHGYNITETSVKNAKRSTAYAHLIPETENVKPVVAMLRQEFPELPIDVLLAPLCH